MSIASPFSRVVLPDGARPDLAYQVIETVAAPPPATNLLYKIPGERYDEPISIAIALQTSAAPGNRLTYLFLYDDQQNVTIAHPAPYQIGATTSGSYRFVGSVSAAYAVPNGGDGYVPIPPLLLMPATYWGIVVVGMQAGDQLSVSHYAHIRIPSGPKLPAAAALAPIPVLL